MDASELEEIAFHRQHGRPETTRGPYYHKTWWESYKGAVKGILGGIVVGGMVGALAGGAVIGVLAATPGVGIGALGATGIGGILAATTLFGMYKGEQKFERVGIATGAVAAAHEISEVRMKEYMRDKMTELTNEVRELKAAVAGKIPMQAMHTGVAAEDTAPIFDESDFRATHQTTDNHRDDDQLFYWNVAAIGATVGAVVGTIAVLAGLGDVVSGASEVAHGAGEATAAATGTAAGAAHGALPHMVSDFIGKFSASLSGVGANTAIVASGAALGASFGVSRDIFRKIFDVTDCWFMGVVDGKCANEEIAKAKGLEFDPLPTARPHSLEKRQKMLMGEQLNAAQAGQETPSAEISNVYIVEPQTAYFQDKPSPEVTKMAILGMDHTTARMH